MPVTDNYIKFSELPMAPEVQSQDTLAILDDSEGVLCRTSINHASEDNQFGLGTQSEYGHNKIVDNLDSENYADGEALSAHQGKVLSDNLTAFASTVNSQLTASNNVPFRFGYNPETEEYGYILNQGGADTVIPFKTKHTGTYKPTERKTDNDMGEKHFYRYVDTTAVPNYNDQPYVFPANSTGAAVDLGVTNTVRTVNASNVYAKGKADVTLRTGSASLTLPEGGGLKSTTYIVPSNATSAYCCIAAWNSYAYNDNLGYSTAKVGSSTVLSNAGCWFGAVSAGTVITLSGECIQEGPSYMQCSCVYRTS